MADQVHQAFVHFADAAGAAAATAGETVAKEEKNGLFDLLVRGVKGSLNGLHTGCKTVGQSAHKECTHVMITASSMMPRWQCSIQMRVHAFLFCFPDRFGDFLIQHVFFLVVFNMRMQTASKECVSTKNVFNDFSSFRALQAFPVPGVLRS
jgi:hypothetical protein